ncbi:hypothetical protein BAMTA208_02960 [Bacillus amyloliquefaciens TA208]|nr:hypothetical protein BAMTA208_02960 [Bacillus amyloliquefaciens TA208]
MTGRFNIAKIIHTIEQATAGTKSEPTPAAAARIVIFCFII